MEFKLVNGALEGNLNEPNPQKTDYKYWEFMKIYRPTGTQGQIVVALFGMGRAGSIHLANLLSNPRVHLKYVVEESAARRKEVEKLLGATSGIKFVGVEDIDTILKDKDLQAVAITTPTQTHTAIIEKALDAGKAVFSEKPIASTLDEVKKCYQKAKKAGLPLLCSFNRRWDPSFDNVARRVHAGELGKVHMIKTCARDSPSPSLEYVRTSNGIFHDCGVHDMDLICYTLKEFPTKVYATATAHRKEIADLDDFDTVAIQMTFKSGCMAHIDLARFAIYGYDQRLEVFGPGGMLQANNQNQLGVQTFTRYAVSDEPIWYSFPSRYSDSYKMALNHFLDVIEGKAECLVTPEETLNICRIADACEKSARTGLPVEVKYD